MLQHGAARCQAVHGQGCQQEHRALAARDAEGQSRQQGPPSLASCAASGASTPRMSPLPKRSAGGRSARRGRRRRSSPPCRRRRGSMPIDGADQRAAQQQPGMPQDGQARRRADAAARARPPDVVDRDGSAPGSAMSCMHLGDREQAEQDGDRRQTVEQIVGAEREARARPCAGPGRRRPASGPARPWPKRAPARPADHGDGGQAPHAQQQELRRPERQEQRAHHRQQGDQDDDAERRSQRRGRRRRRPIAVRACPCCASGWPSSIVAALGAVPGTLNRMAVTDPMNVAPPTSAPKSRTTGSGSQ